MPYHLRHTPRPSLVGSRGNVEPVSRSRRSGNLLLAARLGPCLGHRRIDLGLVGHGIDLLVPSVVKAGIPCIGIASNEEARVARRKVFDMIVNDKVMAGGFHFPFPAFGRVEKLGNGFEFKPVA